jgi:hypothetical protein
MLAQTLILATNWASSFLDRERQKTSNRLDKGGKLCGVVKERHQTVDLKGITKAVKVQLLSSPTGVIPTLQLDLPLRLPWRVAFFRLGRNGATFALFGEVEIFGASATTPLRLSSPETAGRMPGVQTDSCG